MAAGQPDDSGPPAGDGDRRVAAILDITEVLCGKTEYTEVVAAALEASLDTVDAEAGSVLLHSPADDTLVFEYVVGPIAERLLGRSFPSDEGIAGRVFHSGVALLTNDVPGEVSHLRRIADETGYPTVTAITVPLKTLGGLTLGILQAINRRHGSFQKADLELLTIVATQAATIIENARLHEAARFGAAARLLGNVGHDVKNMIAPVVTCAAALETILNKHFGLLDAAIERSQTDSGLPADFATRVAQTQARCIEAIRVLERAAERVRERTQQMADCLRGNITPPSMRPTDIGKVVSEVVETLGPTAQERGINLDMEVAENCPEVLADGSRLFNAIYNLVINAIPETPPGGSVTVHVESSPVGPLRGMGSVQISVRDSGYGIAPEVFHKLFTGETVPTTKRDGIGLGTRIVKDVADVHGGTVSATSEPGKGSCFTLTLPLRPMAGPGRREPHEGTT